MAKSVLSMLSVKEGVATRELYREAQRHRKRDPTLRLPGSPNTLNKYLTALLGVALVLRVPPEREAKRGEKVLWCLSPHAGQYVKLTNTAKPTVGEIVSLKNFDSIPLQEADMFLYSRRPFNELLGRHREALFGQIAEEGEKLIDTLERALQDKAYRKYILLNGPPPTWNRDDWDELDLLERRLRVEIETKNPKDVAQALRMAPLRKRRKNISGSLRYTAKKLGINPSKLSRKHRNEIKRLAREDSSVATWSDIVNEHLSKEEMANRDDRINRQERYDEFEKLMQDAVPPVAVLVCNDKFLDELAVSEDVPVALSSRTRELIRLDEIFARLSNKKLRTAEKMFWEAVNTRKFRRTLSFRRGFGGHGRGPIDWSYGEIQGPQDILDLGITLPPHLRDQASNRQRFFLKVYKALKTELEERDLQPLKPNNSARPEEIIHEIDREVGIKGKVRKKNGEIIVTYPPPPGLQPTISGIMTADRATE